MEYRYLFRYWWLFVGVWWNVDFPAYELGLMILMKDSLSTIPLLSISNRFNMDINSSS